MLRPGWEKTNLHLARAAVTVTALALAVAGCQKTKTAKVDPELGVAPSPRVVAEGKPIPPGGGRFLIGEDYRIANKTYKPRADPNYNRVGVASYYGRAFHGRKTANGEVFDMYALSAAHPTLPLPSYVRVTNLSNQRSVIVRVNDRGPFAHGRIIDVSQRAADLLGFTRSGTAKVRVQFVETARLDGKDSRYLLASYRGPGTAPPDVQPKSRPQVDGGTMIAALQVNNEAPLGERVPEHIVESGTPFDPYSAVAGPIRAALVHPKSDGSLFGLNIFGGSRKSETYRTSFVATGTPNPAVRAITTQFH